METYKVICTALYNTAFIYPIAILILYGRLASISISYYELSKKRSWIFSVFCWTMAFPAVIIMPEPLMIVSGAALMFVGAAAHYADREGYYRPVQGYKVHIMNSYLAVGTSQIGLAYHYQFYDLTALFVILTLCWVLTKNQYKTLYIEYLAMLTSSIAIFRVIGVLDNWTWPIIDFLKALI